MTLHKKDTMDLPDAGGLTLTKETIVSVMEEEIELNGLEEAKRSFSVMSRCFSRLEGWPAVERVVIDLFKREKKRLERKEANRITEMSGKNLIYMEGHGTIMLPPDNH